MTWRHSSCSSLVFVAGHQKKMMLAIDRLKKLKLAAKRSAQQHAELFQASEQSPSMCEGHPSPSVVYYSPSKPPRSPGYFLTSTADIYRRPGESLYAAQPRSLTAHQPEMVAIQVKRSANVQSPAVYDVPVVSPAGYESFHGVAARDANVGRDVSPYDNAAVSRMRRASDDGYASTPCSASPYSMMTPPPCISSGNVHFPPCRGSAPSTPLHITSRLTPSTVTPKKIPPVPPQRTNSVKMSVSPLVSDMNSQHSSTQSRLANCGSLDRTPKNHKQPAIATDNVMPCPVTTSTSATVMSTMAETGSTGDCSTLPFANENIGTIRQRGPASATHGMNSSDDDEDKPLYDEYSGTVRRRGSYLCVLTCSNLAVLSLMIHFFFMV